LSSGFPTPIPSRAFRAPWSSATTDPDPCEAGTYHGFSRSGAPALDAIKKWVLSLKR
jgi:hypothetical protein